MSGEPRPVDEGAMAAVAEVLAVSFDEWLFRMHGVTSSCDHSTEGRAMAEDLLASPALADPIAAAEQRGREDNADHGMCFVSGSKALEAKLAGAWDEGYAAGADHWGLIDPPSDEPTNPYREEVSDGGR